MKKIVKPFIALSLILSLLIGMINTSHADSSSDIYDYEIVELNELKKFNTTKQGQNYSLSFRLGEDKYGIELLADFYTLEGSALTENKFLADVISSNYEILHLSLATEPGIRDKKIKLNKDQVLLNVAVVIPEKQEVVRVSYPLTKNKESGTIAEIINNAKSLSLDTDEDLYTKLFRSETWSIPFTPSNRNINSKNSSEKDTQPMFTTFSTTQIEGDTYGVVNGYIPEQYFKSSTSGVFHGTKNDTNTGRLAKGYIRETFEESDGTITTMAALFDFSMNITDSSTSTTDARDSLTEVQRAYNIFASYDPVQDVITVTYADDNSTFLLTKDPGMGQRITGSGTEGYYNKYWFEQYAGGSSSGSLSSIVITLLGMRYSWVGVASTTYQFMEDYLGNLSGQTYDSSGDHYNIDDVVDSKYAKNIGGYYQGDFYKKYALIKSRGNIVGFSGDTDSKVYYQFEIRSIPSKGTTTYRTRFDYSADL